VNKICHHCISSNQTKKSNQLTSQSFLRKLMSDENKFQLSTENLLTQTNLLFQKIETLYDIIESMKKDNKPDAVLNSKLIQTQSEINNIKLNIEQINTTGNPSNQRKMSV